MFLQRKVDIYLWEACPSEKGRGLTPYLMGNVSLLPSNYTQITYRKKLKALECLKQFSDIRHMRKPVERGRKRQMIIPVIL